MKEPKETRRDLRHAQIVELLSGDIKGVRSLWLRLQIARDAELRREYYETRELWRSLTVLKATEPGPRPVWPTVSRPSGPTVTFGGKTMDRRVFLLAYGSLLLAITSTFVLHDRGQQIKKEAKSVAHSMNDLTVIGESGASIAIDTAEARDRAGNQAGSITFVYDSVPGKEVRWMVDAPFVGETRLLDSTEKVVGTTSHPDDPNHRYGGSPRAWVTLNDHVVLLKTEVGNYRPQRFTFRDKSGNILGFVEMAPDTPSQQRAEMDQHFRSLGIEEPFEGSSGCKDGIGETSGYFQPAGVGGSKSSSATAAWNFKGTGEIRIRRKGGKVLRRGFASPFEDATPTEPVLEWNNESKVQTFRGYGTFEVSLPNGDPLTVEVIRWEDRWQSSH